MKRTVLAVMLILALSTFAGAQAKPTVSLKYVAAQEGTRCR